MSEALSLQTFLKSEKALKSLDLLRRGQALTTLDLKSLAPDERTYVEAEACVRDVTYSKLENLIQPGTSEWVRTLSFCYRDLFTNPQRALDALDSLEASSPSHHEFPLRLKFWRAHLNLLLGRVEIGKRALIQIASREIPESLWKGEMLTIRALGYYFTGRTRESIEAHRKCQNQINEGQDKFLQSFNSGMATRAALKLCDPESFEYFTQKLEEALLEKNDSRYRLRHTGYRATIFNQLGEHSLADTYWKKGDEQLHSTESALERGQYFILRGLSHSLTGEMALAERAFDLSVHELKLAGSPALYLAELDIARHLAEIANPVNRSRNLSHSLSIAQIAETKFRGQSKEHPYPIQDMYLEGASFCSNLISGSTLQSSQDGRQSLVLSVIENISRSSSFARGLSHFRLIPNFVHAVSESDLSEIGISSALHETLKVKPIYDGESFSLPRNFEFIQSEPEVRTVLEFGSTLHSLGEKSEKLFETESRLKEATRAKHLLHDLRFFAMDLANHAKKPNCAINLAKLSEHLNDLIESYLISTKNGENPSLPTIVYFQTLLEEVVETASVVTGTKINAPRTSNNSFLWTSGVLLKRILLNIIKNGIEAGSGEFPITLSCKIEGEGAGLPRIVLYVSDNGSGLNPNFFSQMRDSSYSISASTKSNGFGLGLRSAMECAEEIGVSLELVSKGQRSGTVFKIGIPMVTDVILGSQPEILIIDDSAAVRESWNIFGKTERIDVECTHGPSAVARLNRLPGSLQWLILDYDLKLSNCTGADIAGPLFGRGFKVALSTGFQASELPDDVRTLPWDAILSKEPQYPVEMKREDSVKDNPLTSDEAKQQNQVDRYPAHLRHELKNELTPLKTALRGLSTQHPEDPYLPLIAASIRGIEKLIKPKEVVSRG